MWYDSRHQTCTVLRDLTDLHDVAGIAMYSSIMKTRTRPGDWLVLPGAGGGLGHMYVFNHHIYSAKHEMTWYGTALAHTLAFRGVQIAVKKGLKVIAIDRYEISQNQRTYQGKTNPKQRREEETTMPKTRGHSLL